MSANRHNTDSGNADSTDPAFSPDGTKVAFSSWAHDIGPVVANPDGQDVFVRDLRTNTTALVSIAANPNEDGNGRSCCGTFSPDGTKLAFTIYADNLGPTDTNGDQDVYVRDLAAGTTTLVSANAEGTDSGAGRSVDSRWTADGAAILFESDASNLGPVDDNGLIDVYIRYLGSGATGSMSGCANGTSRLVEHMLGRNRIFPADRVLFRTLATDLGPTDENGKWDVYTSSPKPA